MGHGCTRMEIRNADSAEDADKRRSIQFYFPDLRSSASICGSAHLRESSMLSILNSLPLLGSVLNISRVLVLGPVRVSIWRMTVGFWLIGQLWLMLVVMVAPSSEISPVPTMMPVLQLSIQVETTF